MEFLVRGLVGSKIQVQGRTGLWLVLKRLRLVAQIFHRFPLVSLFSTSFTPKFSWISNFLFVLAKTCSMSPPKRIAPRPLADKQAEITKLSQFKFKTNLCIATCTLHVCVVLYTFTQFSSLICSAIYQVIGENDLLQGDGKLKDFSDFPNRIFLQKCIRASNLIDLPQRWLEISFYSTNKFFFLFQVFSNRSKWNSSLHQLILRETKTKGKNFVYKT